MIPLAEARSYVLDRCRATPTEAVAVADADGLVLRSPVSAPEAVPPFDNTAMDGFAVRSVDTIGAPVELAVVDTLPAGVAPTRAVGSGEAIRIMTGAPMPAGADAVVMVERTAAVGADRVLVEVVVESGNHVRRAGDDLSAGDEVFGAGTALTPAHLGVLASIGAVDVRVGRRPRVGVLSTGDELVGAGEPLGPGQIRDSNRTALLAALAELGVVPVDLGLVADDEDLIREALMAGIASCDALCTSGGVSMGDFDYVKTVLDEVAEMRWMQVAIKPAKPFAFGVSGPVPIFGLPGNPVSSLVSFELFARPALRRMMGYERLDRPRVSAVAADGLVRRPDGKTHFARVALEQDEHGFVVRSAGAQGSHQLRAMADANGLAVLPDGAGVEPGASVSVIVLARF
jgi:molybdenum cofactor synthesis domain-containing protein